MLPNVMRENTHSIINYPSSEDCLRSVMWNLAIKKC